MNIFYLNREPLTCAQMHCDKHVVKMVIEYAQLLSTAHRILDGKKTDFVLNEKRSVKGELIFKSRIKTLHLMPGEVGVIVRNSTDYPDEDRKIVVLDNQVIYTASHVQHPAGIWLRSSFQNYTWLYRMFSHLLDEYTHRYGRVHSTARLREHLGLAPNNIPDGRFSDPPQSMDVMYKDLDAVSAYQNYYVGAKARFARWTDREVPQWFKERIPGYDESNFVRTRRVAEVAGDGGGTLHRDPEGEGLQAPGWQRRAS